MMPAAPSSESWDSHTVQHYERHAASLIAHAHNLHAVTWYRHLTSMLPPPAHILDAGCGAGYASRFFLDHGYTVTAFDAALPLVTFARTPLQQPVFQLRFDTIPFSNQFDAIWACASLLHVPRHSLPSILQRLARALKPAGVCYMNFVYGPEETTRGGLYFNDQTEATIAATIAGVPGLHMLHQWTSPDLPPTRSDRAWLHVLARTEHASAAVS